MGCNNNNNTTTTVVDVIELACEGIKIKRKNAAMTSRQTDLEAELGKIPAAKRTMRSKITAAENRIRTLEKQLSNARVALEK